jgi:flagellar biosynthesis protein FlhG
MHPVQVIAVTGGKGGVGKTSVSVNLSVALAQMGRRVALLDADLGLANVDIMLGLNAKHNLEDVLAGTYSLMDIMLTGPAGIRIIPASSGTQRMAQLGALEHAGLIHAFSEISDQIDVLIIDTSHRRSPIRMR